MNTIDTLNVAFAASIEALCKEYGIEAEFAALGERHCKQCDSHIMFGRCLCGSSEDRMINALTASLRETRASTSLLEAARAWFRNKSDPKLGREVEDALLDWMKERDHRERKRSLLRLRGEAQLAGKEAWQLQLEREAVMPGEAPISPTWGNAVPMCSEENCAWYDGKRCKVIGAKPYVCEPAVQGMADRMRDQ